MTDSCYYAVGHSGEYFSMRGRYLETIGNTRVTSMEVEESLAMDICSESKVAIAVCVRHSVIYCKDVFNCVRNFIFSVIMGFYYRIGELVSQELTGLVMGNVQIEVINSVNIVDIVCDDFIHFVILYLINILYMGIEMNLCPRDLLDL